MWTDDPGAIDRRERDGRLTDRQAAMVRCWQRDGFLRLDRPAPRDRLEPAALDLERLFAGVRPALPFDCPALAAAPMSWQAEIAPHPAAALDPHAVSAPIRSLILDDPLAEFLPLLLEDRILLAASRGFLREPVGVPHRASARFGCSVPNRFVSVRIALQDGAGLAVWPASHRLPDRTPADPPLPLSLSRGDAVLLHPDLLHAAIALPPLATARGIVAQLCPATLSPGYAQRVPSARHAHGKDSFASEFCPDVAALT